MTTVDSVKKLAARLASKYPGRKRDIYEIAEFAVDSESAACAMRELNSIVFTNRKRKRTEEEYD